MELLLVVPPGVPSAVVHPVAPPEARKQTPTGKGRVRTGAQKKLRAAAEAKRQEKAKEAGDLCCPVCADVGTQKLFKGVPGFVGHLNSHIAHDVPVPDLFWASQSVVRCCRVCRQVFGNTGNRVQTVCGACRKLKLSEPLPVPAGEEDVGIMAEAEPVASVLLPLPAGLPTMEEIMAQPLLTASRVPSPVRARWTKIFAKLCSDAVHHGDNPKFWVLWAMFQQAGLCQPPRAGMKNKNYLSQQLDAWERDPLELWRKLKARQQPRSQRPADNSPEARARRAVQAAREGMASRARAAL